MIKQKVCACWGCCRKIYCYLPMAVLLFWVFYPFVLNLVSSNTELLDNRPLKTKPTDFGTHFSQNFTDYYNDTFAGRKKLIVKYVKLKQRLKIDTGQYFYGQHGWMFYDSAKVNNANSMLDYYATVKFDESESQQMVAGLKLEKAFFERYGAQYMIVVAPNKENVYSEFMPERMQKMRVSDYSLSDAGADYANANGIRILNLKPVLLQAKNKVPYRLYYKKDTHWNSLGAYEGFYALMQDLQRLGAGGVLQPLTSEMISSAGLVGQDMHPTDKDMSYAVKYLDGKSFEKTVVKAGKIIVYDNKNPVSDKVILLSGDSFAEALLPYLAKNYKRVVNVPNGLKDLKFYEDVMTTYKPDVVVKEIVERYFRLLVNAGKLYRQD